MKILFVCADMSQFGGISFYCRVLLGALRENGHEVLLVERKFYFFSKVFFFIDFIVKTLWFRPKFIVCGHVNFSVLPYVVSRFLDQKYAVLTHGIEVWNMKSALLLRTLRNATCVVSVSEYTRSKLKAYLVQTQKVFVLPSCVHGEKFFIKEKPGSLFSRHNIPKEAKIILTVTRLLYSEGYKGYDRVIEALPLIHKTIPDVHYVIVGGGDDVVRAQALADRAGVRDFVTFAGAVSDAELPLYYHLCDLFVMLSKGEGFGTAYLEALACGKPTIADSEGGARDALLRGELGLLIDSSSVDKIVESVLLMFYKRVSPQLTDPQFLRKKVLEVYGYKKFVERVSELIQFFS